jgi:hypothetical protein
MTRDKLVKYSKENSFEILFGIEEIDEEACRKLQDYREYVTRYDEDSISSMKLYLNDAEMYLGDAKDYLDIAYNSIDGWRDLALSLWEKLDKDKQEDYIDYWRLTEAKRKSVKNAFKLEDLNKL